MLSQEIVDVVTAYQEGHEIECKSKNRRDAEWIGIFEPYWDFGDFDYRVRPTFPEYIYVSDDPLTIHRDPSDKDAIVARYQLVQSECHPTTAESSQH